MSNPYAEDYPILPMHEIRRMLLQYRRHKKDCCFAKAANIITILDISREAIVHRMVLMRIMDGKDPIDAKMHLRFGEKIQRRLSRWLIKAECGMIIKKDGVVSYLSEPTKPMPVVRRVHLSLVSGARMTKAEQIQAPGRMPSFLDIFARAPTIQLPRGLR